MLGVDHIDVAYGRAKVLHDISLRVQRGEVVFIAGRNGAGKTTLLKTIAGFLAPRRGTITFDGSSVVGEPPEQIALRGLRYVFQDKRVFSRLTVRENLELAAYPVREKIDEAIQKVISIYPKMEQFLNAHAGGLSGGQRQILLIGRALVGRPKMLLIDEPTEGLAAGTINDVISVLNKMKEEMSLVIVEQNLSVVGLLADRVYIMSEGKIAAEIKDKEDIQNKKILESCL